MSEDQTSNAPEPVALAFINRELKGFKNANGLLSHILNELQDFVSGKPAKRQYIEIATEDVALSVPTDNIAGIRVFQDNQRREYLLRVDRKVGSETLMRIPMLEAVEEPAQ